MIVRVPDIALVNRTIFAEIVDADDDVAGLQKFLDQIAADAFDSSTGRTLPARGRYGGCVRTKHLAR
jgi:hypothetical protein